MKRRTDKKKLAIDLIYYESIEAKLKLSSEAIAHKIYSHMDSVSEYRCVEITDRFCSLAVMNLNCHDRQMQFEHKAIQGSL